MKPDRRIHLTLILLALVAASLACSAPVADKLPFTVPGGPEPTMTFLVLPTANLPTEPLPVSGGQSVPASGQQAQASPAARYLGQTVQQDGIALTTLAVQDPAKGTGLYQAEAGKRLYAVEISVANLTRDALNVNPLDAVLADASGKLYAVELGAIQGQLKSASLKPGETARGWVAFKVPDGAQPASLEYGIGLLGINALQAGLAMPPGWFTPPADPSEASATPTPEVVTYLGDAVENNGAALVPLSVADPAQPSGFYQQQQGKKLIAVELVVANVSSAAVRANPINAVLVDTGGATYRAALGAVAGQLPMLTLLPGEHVQGWVAFETPVNAAAARIAYQLESGDGAAIQAGLGKAPAGRASVLLPASPPPTGLPRLGQRVEQSGYALTATGIQDPAKPGPLYQKRDGYRLVAVQIAVENVSAGSTTVNALNAYLVDNQGFVYTAVLGGVDNQISVTTINQGQKAWGWVAFEVPEGVQPASLKYATGSAGNVVLQTGVTK